MLCKRIIFTDKGFQYGVFQVQSGFGDCDIGSCSRCSCRLQVCVTDAVVGSRCLDKVYFGQVLSSGESTSTVCGVNCQLLAVMLHGLSNEQLPVAVDHSQLWTMASDTVDSIDWPLPFTRHRAVPPEFHFHDANAGHKSQHLLQQVGS